MIAVDDYGSSSVSTPQQETALEELARIDRSCEEIDRSCEELDRIIEETDRRIEEMTREGEERERRHNELMRLAQEVIERRRLEEEALEEQNRNRIGKVVHCM
ncbi:hypothetical protein AGMMS49950_10440 [Endomicrobiia bacterium]|nr:hypothetical protein AGMMS49950_10440 [Endomicrobiia bacterium]